jgi:hypothetical protein
MHADDKELKAQMMSAAEDVIERLIAGAKENEELSLGDIERLVRRAGQDTMRDLTEMLADAEAQSEEDRRCPECGREMRYKGRKKRDVIAETGEVSVERGYYYCPSCRKGVFPPRPAMGAEQDGI